MKRLMFLGMLFCCVFLAGGAVSAQPAEPRSVVSVIANIETEQTRVLADGNTLNQTTTGRFYRDDHGRTRLEQGTTATINDPVDRVTIILDLTRRAARKIDFPKITQRPQRTSQPAPSDLTAQRSQLGTQAIEGIEVVGEQLVTVLPAGSFVGNAKPIEQTTQVWHSKALQLAILVTVSDPVAGKTTTRFKNIQQGVSIDPTLFEVPAGFQVSQGMN